MKLAVLQTAYSGAVINLASHNITGSLVWATQAARIVQHCLCCTRFQTASVQYAQLPKQLWQQALSLAPCASLFTASLGQVEAHCVQLSYSSPTFGASGLYVRDGVSSSIFIAAPSSSRPPASASSRGSTPKGSKVGGVACSACKVGVARQPVCARKERQLLS